jgi:hypothetical protein
MWKSGNAKAVEKKNKFGNEAGIANAGNASL